MTITIHKSNSNLQQKGAGVWDSVLSLVNQFGGQLGLKDHTHTHTCPLPNPSINCALGLGSCNRDQK